MSDFANRDTGSQPQLRGIERPFRVRYTMLTLGIFLPLIWAFATIKNVYPVSASTVMMAGGNLQRTHTYFILRGETMSGEVVDISPITLTDGLYARTWSMVAATVNNNSFQLRSMHPDNAALLNTSAGLGGLPRAVRLPQLLRVWGDLYNSRLPASAPGRLRAIRLDAYQWMGQQYSNYDHFIESWREEL